MNKFIKKHVDWQQKVYNKLGRKVFIIIAPMLFFIFIFSPSYFLYKKIEIPLGLSYPINIYLGILILVIGLALYIWTIMLFSQVEGTQAPIAPTQKLVTTGAFAISRNPMVTGVILFVLGLGIILNSLSFILIGFVIPISYLIYIKLIEEKELEARFGEEYIAYKKKTPFLIPKLRGDKKHFKRKN